jgi:STE24 endopeptidase
MNEDKGARYHRLRRQAVIGSTLFGAAWLGGLYASGASAGLARVAGRIGAAMPPALAFPVAVVAVVAVLAAGFELIALPISAYRGWFLERRYGLSTESFSQWCRDHAKSFTVGLVLATGAALAVYACVRLAGDWWWLAAAAVFSLVTIGLATAAPVLVMPIFYRFRPLERDALRDRLLALCEEANVPVLGVFEWGLGEKSTRANAALAGMGRTRRILLSDTLLAGYSDDEIAVVLAHELAHHVHRDLWSGLALEAGTLALAFFAAARVVEHPEDLAALPLLALVFGGVSILMTPLANAWSRHNERLADRFALDLTGLSAPFVSAMRRLSTQNLADERPSAVSYWFFHSHPTVEERIAAARTDSRPANP